MKDLALHWKIIIGLVLGIIYSFISSYMGWNAFTINWIDPFGTIFIRLLKFIAVPLVLFSIIMGISSLPDLSKLGSMGAKTFGAYLVTTVAAVGFGLLFVNILQPGAQIAEEQRIKNRLKYELWVENTPDVEILDGKSYRTDPAYASLVSTAAQELSSDQEKAAKDKSVQKKMKDAGEMKHSSPLTFIVDMVPDNIFAALTDGKKMLQVIFFAIFFGLVLVCLLYTSPSPRDS